MSEEEQRIHWINNDVLTPEERITYLEREIELALEQGEINGRKKVVTALSESGVGHYAGEGLFVLDLKGHAGKIIKIDIGSGF
jgi:hypothetical protein